MKRKILTSLIVFPMLATSMATIVSCSQKSETEQKTPLTAAETTYVTFLPKPGDEGKVIFSGETYVKATVGMPFATLVTPTATKSKYVVSAWTDIAGNEFKLTDPITKDMKVYPKFDADVDLTSCVGITALDDSIVTIIKHGAYTPQIKYSTDGKFWTEYDWTKSEQGKLVLELKPGEVLYFKGNNLVEDPETGEKIRWGLSHSETEYTSFSIGGTVSLNGNVMTLLDDGQGTTDYIPCDYCFYRLFEGCSGIVSISSNFLRAVHLKNYSYAYMFENCQRLTDFPRTLLSDDELYEDSEYQATLCYAGMFSNCIGIKHIPTDLLPATKLSTYCYYGMFQGCTGLTELNAGILPATELYVKLDNTYCLDYYGCYCNMFADCTNIAKINESADNMLLPATKLARNCYYTMFAGCTKLTNLSGGTSSGLRLPATDLTFGGLRPKDAAVTGAENCYNQMFYGCTNLTAAPTLLATKLSVGCYSGMFYNCHSLSTLPTLPTGDYTLADKCFQYMFYNCTSLETLPQLTATTMKTSCYADMFTNCTGLKTLTASYALGATTLAESCYANMFSGCSNLTQAPIINCDTLAPYCYQYMFEGCTSLTAAPSLPAKNAAVGCYMEMFANCSKLTSSSISLTSLANYCCYFMFVNCTSFDIEYRGQSQGILCFTCPSTSGLTDPVSSMFQGTVNHPDDVGTPSRNETWRYILPTP